MELYMYTFGGEDDTEVVEVEVVDEEDGTSKGYDLLSLARG